MIDEEKRNTKWQQKEKVRRRMRVEIDPDNYEYIPEKKKTDYYDTETPQLVGIYVRVSTDDVRQTTSFELQKKYYEEFVSRHPNWTLVKIYADEGISGTSLKNRDEFKQMIADAKAGKLTLIITKSVSRFARNQYDFIGIVRELAERKPAVGVFFESEAIFSLNEDSSMALSFQATMAEEESHTRSRSMETSLRMRLDHGLPLTPKLLGYSHDADGNLIINPDEAPTVKLAFYMYLFGYSSGQIAKAFIALERKSYLGNTTKWTSGSIIQILRNERHCGDVITRKTYTENYRTHRTLINKGDRPQSHYSNHHEAIVSKADYIAVQHMIENARYGNRAFLPELRVIDSGILKGFVGIHPRWANFKEGDYFQAAVSVYDNIEEATETAIPPTEIQIEVAAGDFDLRGFEVARAEFFDTPHRPYVTFADKKIKFNTDCIRKLGAKNYCFCRIDVVCKQHCADTEKVTIGLCVSLDFRIGGCVGRKAELRLVFFITLAITAQMDLNLTLYKCLGNFLIPKPRTIGFKLKFFGREGIFIEDFQGRNKPMRQGRLTARYDNIHNGAIYRGKDIFEPCIKRFVRCRVVATPHALCRVSFAYFLAKATLKYLFCQANFTICVAFVVDNQNKAGYAHLVFSVYFLEMFSCD